MDDKKSFLTTLPPLLVAVGTLITAVIGLGNFMSTPAPSIAGFDVSPSIIDSGGNATLKWSISGDAQSVSINPGIGTVALSGSRQVSPVNTTNYTLIANNKGQIKTATAQLIVRTVKAAQGGDQKSNNGSIQKPIPPSAPFSTNKVGDEPVHNNVPVSINAVNSAGSTNNVKSASDANSATIANKASNADSAGNANTIDTASTLAANGKDKLAISSERKPSGSYGVVSKDTGDEPIQASNIELTSKSKEPNESINASSNSATGDEPIQMMNSKNPSINPTEQTKAAAGAAKTQSNVGDFA
ncbi:MAG: hypothetical protein ACE14P_06740 [Methanotrichaceae archaeon]